LNDIIPQAFVQSSTNFTGNQIVDPGIRGISRTQDGTLDPRPSGTGPAATVSVVAPNDGFFTQANYAGAFDPNGSLWTAGWTALSQDSITTGIKDQEGQIVPADFVLEQNYPNPFNPSTMIDFYVPHRAHVNLAVYNMLGQKVATLVSEYHEAGPYTVEWLASDLTSGMYIYRLKAGETVITKKMILMK
jgi:hypothetical protein